MACQVTESLSIGVSPTFDIAQIQLAPFPFASPIAGQYPSATNTHQFYGGGFQVGLLYRTPVGVNFGASFKSPQWFKTFDFNATDPITGLNREITADFRYPMIASVGAAWTNYQLTLLADVRWIDFNSIPIFGDSAGFDTTGAVTGLGWESVFSAALGAQYLLSDRVHLRVGYTATENPISGRDAMFSIPAPAIFQHAFDLGATLQLTDYISVSATWTHAFTNEIDGQLMSPAIGPLPGSSITIEETIDSAVSWASASFIKRRRFGKVSRGF